VESYRDSLTALVSERSSQLHDSTAQLTTLYQLSPDGFVSFDRGSRVSFASPAFYRLTGLCEADIAGLDEAGFSERIAAHCQSGGGFPGFTALRAQPLKRHRMEWMGASRCVLELALHTNANGTISHVLHVRDVTHETAVDHLKNEFLHTAAHELRTPMTSLYGFAELLMTEELDEQSRQEFLGIIVKQSKQLMGITNALVDLNHIATRHNRDFDFKALDLGQFLRDALPHLPTPEGRDLPLAESPDGAMQVLADAGKLQQVLANLLSNAYKYSRPGTPVRIRCVRLVEHDEPMVGIEVRDQGIGMTATQITRCCDRFYRADSSGQLAGAGLGLSLAKEIMHLHGGHIGIHSKPGHGTEVTLWLKAIPNQSSGHSSV
jgi:signal transduction histidine kinase